jgi:hypothetical protein
LDYWQKIFPHKQAKSGTTLKIASKQMLIAARAVGAPAGNPTALIINSRP